MGDSPTTLKDFFSNKLYNKASILNYELGFDRNMVGVGGMETTKKYCDMFELTTDDVALEIGCGLGGNLFYVSDHFGCRSVGLDISSNMIEIANERLKEQPHFIQERVEFMTGDAMEMKFQNNSFKAVFGKDTFLYIEDKPKFFSLIYDWLAPGGLLIFLDHNLGKAEQNCEKFNEYRRSRKWKVVTIQEQKDILENAGFQKVAALDKTDDFARYTKLHMEAYEANKHIYMKTTSLQDYEREINLRKNKIKWTAENFLAWGCFIARK